MHGRGDEERDGDRGASEREARAAAWESGSEAGRQPVEAVRARLAVRADVHEHSGGRSDVASRRAGDGAGTGRAVDPVEGLREPRDDELDTALVELGPADLASRHSSGLYRPGRLNHMSVQSPGSCVLPYAVLLVGAILLAVFVLPPLWGLVAVTVAAVVEIGEFFFWIWLSRRRGVQAGAEALVGKTARVVAPCRPDGRVRVEGELWRARCEAGADVGESVRIVSVEELTLEVARID